MRRSLTFFLFVSPLLAQPLRPVPQQAPIDALTRSYQSAFSGGRFDEAAAKRDQARELLSQIPANDPQFANWAQRVSQLYEAGGFAQQARDVLEQALAKAGGLGESSSIRVTLLDALSRSWQEDRNLIKSLSYLEQAVAAAEAQPPQTAQVAGPVSPWFAVTGALSAAPPMISQVGAFRSDLSSYGALYQRLFGLYRQLGRPEDAAAVLIRVRTHVKNSDRLVAELYQETGQFDEAAAIYKNAAEQATDPQQAAVAWQLLANDYQSAERYDDSAAALQQAIARIEASGDPGAAARSIGMRQTLANIFQQGGHIQAADELYRQLTTQAESEQPDLQTGVVTGYAAFLAQTNRSAQAEVLLKDYQTSHVSTEPWQQSNLMLALANVERLSGKPLLAEEYQRQAFANQPQPSNQSAEPGVGDTLQRAQQAANAGKTDEAFSLTLQALDLAPGASDREMTPWAAVNVADMLVSRKASAKGDEIYRRVMGLAGDEAPATISPLLNAYQKYARSLASQQRWNDFDRALERYSSTLITARGSGTGWLEDVLRLRAEINNCSERRQDVLLASQELLKLEESLNGGTSEFYLRAAQTLSTALESAGDPAGALPLHREIVAIADLVYPRNDFRRAKVRDSAAMAYARQGQFDQAERLAREAVIICQATQSRQFRGFDNDLLQILKMKQAAQAAPAPKR